MAYPSDDAQTGPEAVNQVTCHFFTNLPEEFRVPDAPLVCSNETMKTTHHLQSFHTYSPLISFAGGAI
jgi:hypothetical protein